MGKDPVRHLVLRVRPGAFHLVENDTLDLGGIRLRVRNIVPALLHEGIGALQDIGMEDRVQIYVHQGLEILVVLTGDGVHRHLRPGHRVQEGIHGAFLQLHERVLQRILFGTA